MTVQLRFARMKNPQCNTPEGIKFKNRMLQGACVSCNGIILWYIYIYIYQMTLALHAPSPLLELLEIFNLQCYTCNAYLLRFGACCHSLLGHTYCYDTDTVHLKINIALLHFKFFFQYTKTFKNHPTDFLNKTYFRQIGTSEVN